MSDLLRVLLEPFTLLHLLIGLGLLRLWWRRAETRRRLWWLTAPYLLLTLIATPAVIFLAVGTLEWRYPPLMHRPQDAEAIVVLGSAVAHFDPALDKAQLDGPARDRTWHAFRLYRSASPCPVLVSGGKPDADEPDPAVADVMAEELRRLGVAARDIVVENQSQKTHENAVESARILRGRGIERIVLVSDAAHLPRAAACFRKEGIEVLPSGCRPRARWRTSVTMFVPSLAGLVGFSDTAREWLRLAGYRVRGWI
jgi:uncharacterized SAM-binding protein YcdF (DUF218 family)